MNQKSLGKRDELVTLTCLAFSTLFQHLLHTHTHTHKYTYTDTFTNTHTQMHTYKLTWTNTFNLYSSLVLNLQASCGELNKLKDYINKRMHIQWILCVFALYSSLHNHIWYLWRWGEEVRSWSERKKLQAKLCLNRTKQRWLSSQDRHRRQSRKKLGWL